MKEALERINLKWTQYSLSKHKENPENTQTTGKPKYMPEQGERANSMPTKDKNVSLLILNMLILLFTKVY